MTVTTVSFREDKPRFITNWKFQADVLKRPLFVCLRVPAACPPTRGRKTIKILEMLFFMDDSSDYRWPRGWKTIKILENSIFYGYFRDF